MTWRGAGGFEECERALRDGAKLAALLESTRAGFPDLVEASTRYVCVKRDWAECLGESLGATTERIE